jgi:hypothetical protein
MSRDISSDVEISMVIFHTILKVKLKVFLHIRFLMSYLVEIIFVLTFRVYRVCCRISDKSMICQANLGYLKTLYIFSPFIKTIMLWVSALVSVVDLATASTFVVFTTTPQTVSVGYK